MSKADFYRRRHKKLMAKEKQEESWPEVILSLVAMLTTIVIWVTVFILMVPEM